MKHIKTYEEMQQDVYSGPLITPMAHNAGITDSNFSVSDGRIGGEFNGSDGSTSTPPGHLTPQTLKYTKLKRNKKRKRFAKMFDDLYKERGTRENESVVLSILAGFFLYKFFQELFQDIRVRKAEKKLKELDFEYILKCMDEKNANIEIKEQLNSFFINIQTKNPIVITIHKITKQVSFFTPLEIFMNAVKLTEEEYQKLLETLKKYEK
jgi:hypothetical protein